MNFDWSEYLYLAQELAGEAQNPVTDEARFRAAISRAYYAAFCNARNHLRDEDGDNAIPKEGVHSYVRRQFQKSSDRRRRKIGADLNRLLTDRQQADYEDSVMNLPIKARYSISLAAQILAELSNL
jgi:uncharacterized protein (UPF0332 family)